MGYRMDDDDRAKIWQLHAAGHNTNEISKLCGRAYATVATLLKGGWRDPTGDHDGGVIVVAATVDGRT